MLITECDAILNYIQHIDNIVKQSSYNNPRVSELTKELKAIVKQELKDILLINYLATEGLQDDT